MRSSADDMRMTYVRADNMWTMFRTTYVIHQPNLQLSLTLVSSARRLHETSSPEIFPVKQQLC